MIIYNCSFSRNLCLFMCNINKIFMINIKTRMGTTCSVDNVCYIFYLLIV